MKALITNQNVCLRQALDEVAIRVFLLSILPIARYLHHHFLYMRMIYNEAISFSEYVVNEKNHYNGEDCTDNKMKLFPSLKSGYLFVTSFLIQCQFQFYETRKVITHPAFAESMGDASFVHLHCLPWHIFSQKNRDFLHIFMCAFVIQKTYCRE